MPDRPILVFPAPIMADRARRPSGGGAVSIPSHSRQVNRLTPQFTALKDAFEGEHAELRPDVGGAEPEKVLVLELSGSVDNFLAAVKRIDGFEWLSAIDEDDLPPDEDFHREKIRTVRS